MRSTTTHTFGVVEFIDYNGKAFHADNYDPEANTDDGSCTYQGICPGDLDADGVIGVMDILELLGLYDTTCD